MTSVPRLSRSDGDVCAVSENEVVPDVADRPPHVGRQEIELLFRLRAEAADRSGRARAARSASLVEVWRLIRSLLSRLSSVLRLAISSLTVVSSSLADSSSSLEVSSSSLMLCSSSLADCDFLVGRLELLVGRLVLLLHGLEVFARLGEFGFELGDAAGLLLRAPVAPEARRLPRMARCHAARPALSASSNTIRKQRSRRFFSGMTSRFTVRVSPLRLTRTFSLRAVLFSFLAWLIAAAQRQHQAFARHLQHVEARLAGGRLEIRAGRPAELQDLQLGIDEHAGRRELIDGDAVGLALGVELAAERFGRRAPARRPADDASGRGARACSFPAAGGTPGSAGFLGVDLVLLVHRLEQVGEAADRFRCAQEQEPSGLERVVERGERLLLQARLEIDQQVPATDEIHARERRVADEVLPREHDHLAQRLA